MTLGIDASNIRSGGGLTHLKEILANADLEKSGFDRVIVWSNKETLNNLPNHNWLVKSTHKYLNKGFIWSFLFQIFILAKQAKKADCAIVFAPGSTFLSSFRPFVTLSQNMLPFESNEAARFPAFKDKLRFKILYKLQSYTFRKANGLIFLTEYAKTFIKAKINLLNPNVIIIPHGISSDFLKQPKFQNEITAYTFEDPFKLLYVSIITVYKHQWNVAEAVLRLRKEGCPVALDLIGPSTSESLQRLNNILDGNNEGVNYVGGVSHSAISEYYKNADGFVFASSCENMPIILIEAMSSGLPIACSNMGPMPEVLGDAGFYFNPLDVNEVHTAIKNMVSSKELRKEKALESYNKSIHYTWKECSMRTFEYLSLVANNYNHENTK